MRYRHWIAIIFGVGLFTGCAQVTKNHAAYEMQRESDRPKLFLISEPTENDGRTLNRDLFPTTIKISRAIIESLDQDQKLIFVGSRTSFLRLKSGLKIDSSARLGHVETAPYYWLQDLFEVYKSKDGAPVLGVPWVNSSVKSVADAIAQNIGGRAIVIKSPLSDNRKPTPATEEGYEILGIHGVVGGNLERWTDNLGLIGLSDFVDESEARRFASVVFSEKMATEVLPTDWLYLGHIDEVVKPILFDKNEAGLCQITALVASPQRALKLINGSAFERLLNANQKPARKVHEMPVYAELCKRMKLDPCTSFAGYELLASEYFNREFLPVQNAIQAQLHRLRERIESALDRSGGGCAVKWIEAPNLYLAQLDSQGQLRRRQARPLFPNLTNGLVVGSSYVVLSSENIAFNNDMQSQLKVRGLQTRFVDAGESLHKGGWADGFIHCMTQIIR